MVAKGTKKMYPACEMARWELGYDDTTFDSMANTKVNEYSGDYKLIIWKWRHTFTGSKFLRAGIQTTPVLSGSTTASSQRHQSAGDPLQLPVRNVTQESRSSRLPSLSPTPKETGKSHSVIIFKSCKTSMMSSKHWNYCNQEPHVWQFCTSRVHPKCDEKLISLFYSLPAHIFDWSLDVVEKNELKMLIG